MPEKVNGNNFSGKSNITSLNSSPITIDSKSAVQLNSTENKLSTLQKMADNSPNSQRFAHFTSMANNSIPKQPVSQLSKDSHSLPDNVKHGVESLSGISMDDVKVHYNSAKPAQLNAHAYAQGTDIHVASGQEKHLPHEAWHVVQQKQGRVRPTTMMKAKVPVNDDQGLEKEADVMGARALQMKPFSLSDYRTGKSVQSKEIIQREPMETIPEGNEEHDEKSDLGDVFNEGAAADQENHLRKESSEEFSPNQRLKTVISEKNALSIKIEEIKVKEEETNAAEEAKKAKIPEVETELKNTEEEIKKAEEEIKKAAAAEALGVAAKAASDLAVADVAAAVKKALAPSYVTAAVKNASAAFGKAKLKSDEFLGERSIIGNVTGTAAYPGRTIDVVAAETNNTNLLEKTGEGAFVGFIADITEGLSSAGKYFNSEKKPADLTLLGLSVGKFVVGVVDGINTGMSNELVGEGLSTSISLLPGIGSGLSAFKNSVEAYQTYIKIKEIENLLILKADGKKAPFTPKEIELIKEYKTELNWRLGKIGVNLLLDVATSISMICPPVMAGLAGLKVAINLFTFGRERYLRYLNDSERKRTERIGEKDVEELKSNKIVEKSEKVGFKVAVADLHKLKRLKNKVPQDADKIKEAQDNLDTNLREINLLKLVNVGSNSLITEENLEDFLNIEKEVIKNIAKEVSEEEAFRKKFYISFKLPQKKDQIIKEMKFKQLFNYDGITVDEIHKISPEMQDYFFDKTQEAIKAACNRQYISANERLDMIEDLLLTKQNDAVIKSYMLDKYKDKDVYGVNDEEEKKFTNSVKRFKKEMEIV